MKENTDKPSPAEKIKPQVVKEQMGPTLSLDRECAARTSAIEKHKTVPFGMGEELNRIRSLHDAE